MESLTTAAKLVGNGFYVTKVMQLSISETLSLNLRLAPSAKSKLFVLTEGVNSLMLSYRTGSKKRVLFLRSQHPIHISKMVLQSNLTKQLMNMPLPC